MSDKINISICLSDIPAEARVKHKNGKTYANFDVKRLKEPNQWGKTHSVAIQQTEEQRTAKAPYLYVGNGKEFNYGN